jgi:hypothetical protein
VSRIFIYIVNSDVTAYHTGRVIDEPSNPILYLNVSVIFHDPSCVRPWVFKKPNSFPLNPDTCQKSLYSGNQDSVSGDTASRRLVWVLDVTLRPIPRTVVRLSLIYLLILLCFTMRNCGTKYGVDIGCLWVSKSP